MHGMTQITQILLPHPSGDRKNIIIHFVFFFCFFIFFFWFGLVVFVYKNNSVGMLMQTLTRNGNKITETERKYNLPLWIFPRIFQRSECLPRDAASVIYKWYSICNNNRTGIFFHLFYRIDCNFNFEIMYECHK